MSQRRQARGASVTMSWDDTWLCVERNGRRMHLSPTQYRICRAFLPTCIPVPAGELTLVAYRSCRELQAETQLPRGALVKHISRANARLAGLGLQLCSFQSGYVLALSW